MRLAAIIPWHAQAKELAEAGVDPSHLFAWPFARVLAVYFLDAAKPREEVVPLRTPADWAAMVAEVKRRKRVADGVE